MPQVVTERLGRYDVLVVGGGIAGAAAALSAAEEGARVGLACAGGLFGGSSFFPGTWGLGLVGPAEGPTSEAGLEQAVLDVGRGMADPGLVHTLVAGVAPGIEWLEQRGCRLRRAEMAGEREFIPCFDRELRSWHGLGRAQFSGALGPALEREGVAVLPRQELMRLTREGAGWKAGLFSQKDGKAAYAEAASVVLATGGLGGLFARTLTMPDVLGTAQAIALGLGAKLVNCEFIQIMCGLTAPVAGVVFNEKAFRYASIDGVGKTSLLEERSGHGPFSASLPDRAVDLAIAGKGAAGAACKLDLPTPLPEFMRTYSDWLREAYGVDGRAELRLAHYAHASNGGILVDGRAAVAGCPGLYACGECTGGMHGADRIGGLASANALVFGRIAGREAAWSARAQGRGVAGAPGPGTPGIDRGVASPRAGSVLTALKQVMAARCMVQRDEEGLEQAAAEIAAGRAQLASTSEPCDEARAVAATRRAELALISAEAMVAAMRARRDSRGAHYRRDFPDEDLAQARPLLVSYEQGRFVAAPA